MSLLLAALAMDGMTAALAGIGIVSIFTMAWDHRVRLETRAQLTELLALAVKRGRPLPGMLRAAATSAQSRAARSATGMLAALERGASLADALGAAGRGCFPRAFIASVRATEGTPALAPVMADLAEADLERLAIHHRLCLCLIYPLLLLSAVAGLQGIGAQLTAAEGVLGIGDGPRLAIAVVPFLIVFPCLGILLWGIVRSNGWVGRGRPVARVDVLRITGRLVATGQGLAVALQRAAGAAENFFVRRSAQQAATQIENGTAPCEAFASLSLSPAVRARLEKQAPDHVSGVLLAVAEEASVRRAQRLTRVLRFAGPAALAIAGALVFYEFRALIEHVDLARTAERLW